MKVELNNSFATQDITDRPSSKVSASVVSSASVSQDRTTFNSKTQSVQSLVTQALSSPEIRQDKVQALKSSISAGEYKIDPQKIARAIVLESGK